MSVSVFEKLPQIANSIFVSAVFKCEKISENKGWSITKRTEKKVNSSVFLSFEIKNLFNGNTLHGHISDPVGHSYLTLLNLN